MVSFPFDSKVTGYDENNYPIYDRAVDSTLLSSVINEFVSTGVFIKESGGFSVAAGEGMTVVVSPGSAIIRGTTCIEKDERTLTVQASDSNYDRIDSVVLRYNNNEDVRAIDLYILQGTASSSPVQPVLTRDDKIYEIAIANIYIPVNSVSVSNERITDTRGDSSRCGWATGVSQDFMESLNNRFAIVNQGIVDNTTKISNNSKSITALSNRVDSLRLSGRLKYFNIYEKELYYNSSGVDQKFEFSITPDFLGGELVIGEDISDRYNYFDSFSVLRRDYHFDGNIYYTISCRSNSHSGFYFNVEVITFNTYFEVQ